MRRKHASAVALAVAACFSGRAIAWQAELAEPPASQESAFVIPPAALIAAGIAAAAAALAAAGGRGGGDAAAPRSEGGAAEPPRALSYTSSADFQTPEYSAQQGLQMVKAANLYYNGHYQWYLRQAPDAAAGTGIGVKIAVADTGITAHEGRTGSAILIDAAASYDYVNGRPGSAADDFGHGTHVAGLIAAPKNGTGMHGLAYNASIVNFKVGNSSGFITASDAQLADMMYRAANAGAMIINNSWGSFAAITDLTAEELHAGMPRMIEASRAYVAKGGVVVFSAGNEERTQPALEAGLPHRIEGIKPGWLAVVAVDGSGRIASYSNRCGVAAAWCLAAPGGAADSMLYSMYGDGYAGGYGTSMAAPHAAGAIGALKSMFPNLSYLQLRDRLLHTANRSGIYNEGTVYGQGLMDLDAASSPVDGVAIPTGASANGATAPVAGSGITFPAGALRALRMQRSVLVVDNYQRAPFWVPAQSFFREAAPRVIERQWASLGSDTRGKPASVHSAGFAAHRVAFSQGAGSEAILGSQLGLAWVPSLASSGADSTALGYAAELGAIRVGVLGTAPSGQANDVRSAESSSLGSRKALGFVAQHRSSGTTSGVTLAFARDFERPIGIATSGAFGVEEGAAVSSGTFVQQAVGEKTMLKASLEVARHRPEGSAAFAAPAYAVRSLNFGARTAIGSKTTLSADVKHEWSGTEAARLQLPLTIAESGEIGQVAYALPYDDLVGRTAVTLRFDHALARQVELRAAVTRERYGFGASATGFAAVLAIETAR